MATQTVAASAGNFTIGRNGSGDVVLGSLSALHDFMLSTSEQLADLTAIVREAFHGRDCVPTLALVNDMAWQLQQAISLAVGEESEVSHG